MTVSTDGSGTAKVTLQVGDLGYYSVVASPGVPTSIQDLDGRLEFIAASVDQILIDLNPGVLLDKQETFTAYGVSYGPDARGDTPDDADPTQPDSVVGDDLALGEVSVQWQVEVSTDPEIEVIASADSTITLEAVGVAGGVLAGGLQAIRGSTIGKVDLVVPWVSKVEVLQEPVVALSLIAQQQQAESLPPRIVEIGVKGIKAPNNTIAVFPGRSAGNAPPHNLVPISATVEPSNDPKVKKILLTKFLHFRSFDVDDEAGKPIDDETKEDDNRSTAIPIAGVVVPPQPGRIEKGGQVETKALIEEQNGELVARVSLRVSFSPGDNYRVVAATDPAVFEFMRTPKDDWGDQPVKGRVVFEAPLKDPVTVPDTARGDPRARASKVITVWRVVHVELDAMAPLVPAERTTAGVLKGCKISGVPTAQAGSTFSIKVVGIDPDLETGTDPTKLNALGFGGGLVITEGKKNTIARVLALVRIEDPNAPGTLLKREARLLLSDVREGALKDGLSCKLFDEDDPGLLDQKQLDVVVGDIKRLTPEFLDSRGDVNKAIFSSKTNAYAPAFMALQYDGGSADKDNKNNQILPPTTQPSPGDPTPRVPFSLYTDLNGPQTEAIVRNAWQSIGSSQDPTYLLVHVLLAYQNRPNEDGDPGFGSGAPQNVQELFFAEGFTNSLGSSQIYLELVREGAAPYSGLSLVKDPYNRELGITAPHEIWHALTGLPDGLPPEPSIDKSTGEGIMSKAYETIPLFKIDEPQPEIFLSNDVINLRRVVDRYLAVRRR